jgi:hypothetical protein
MQSKYIGSYMEDGVLVRVVKPSKRIASAKTFKGAARNKGGSFFRGGNAPSRSVKSAMGNLG